MVKDNQFEYLKDIVDEFITYKKFDMKNKETNVNF